MSNTAARQREVANSGSFITAAKGDKESLRQLILMSMFWLRSDEGPWCHAAVESLRDRVLKLRRPEIHLR